MTIEEKAKAYDEALTTAKRVISNNCTEVEKLCLECVFPQLRESEDERMWKRIIDHFDWHSKPPYLTHQECDEIKAFIEKQKEQKTLSTEEIELNSLAFLEQMGYTCIPPEKEQKPAEQNTREQIVNKATTERQVVLISESNRRAEINWDTRSLEDTKALLEWGLTFINKQLGIKSSEPIPQPKQEWSEEDSDNLERVDNYLLMLDDYVRDDCATPQGKTDNIRGNIQGILSPWLKSLPDRFNLPPKNEWGGEDEKFIKGLCNLLASLAKDNRVGCYYAPDLINKINSLRPQPHTVSIKDATKFGELEYERGIKDGIQSEKSHQWKPSEEQMEALFTASERNDKLGSILNSLYYDLKNNYSYEIH